MLLYERSKNNPKITNTVTTADLRQAVNITRLNDFLWGRYDIENNYNGRVGYVKDNLMQGRVTVFTSGKLISTGAKNVKKSIEQLQKTMELLATNGFIRAVKLEPKVQNIVAILNLQNKIDLNSLSLVFPHSIFEPEQFPGLIHRAENGTTSLIFASGKIIIAGAKSEAQLLDTAHSLEDSLKDFLSPQITTPSPEVNSRPSMRKSA